ncbi:MAG: DEAD/DEAH box helicase [Pirellulaceae bacterium]|nr:DEAD/DEAH box helicase [Pirellulaceae bacterium]
MKQAQKRDIAKTESYTEHQAAYLAHTLTIDGSAEENLSKSLASSKVDMNPHQVEAALFALRSPLSQGVLLADEVGLGKTIEASLIIAQKWAERHRKIILIVPAMLRNQWSQELLEKFNISSYILESSSYNADRKRGMLNPFDRKEDRVLICSYEFASRKNVDLKSVSWDLVVFDEAHKLRNISKKDGAKIAKRLQESLEGCKKILLSATPLQNSLLELYGLVSIIDPHFFGSVESFKVQYVGAKTTANNLDILRHRLSKVCNRTLRRQVQQEGGINFTRRHSIVEDFRPSAEEMELYNQISSYLQRDDIASIKPGARHLVTLVIRKILASSSFAVSGTLDKMIVRLKKSAPADLESLGDYETVGEVADEIDFEDEKRAINQAKLHAEIEELKSYKTLAQKIQQNAKGEALLTVLDKAFSKVEELGGQRKAVIFTESCRTQKYLEELLEINGYERQLALLNGSNSDPNSKRIYKEWLESHAGSDKISGSKTADMKAAIVEQFKNKATILISTESGAEGVNMQFCSLLINYDLPWNPQRVEQRIGRVHRYGQKCDVVVVNFVNKGNKADQLVFELLDRKFKLFEGVFGASDEILGAIESEISIEKRINDILQKCRHTDEIEAEFNTLQTELDDLIKEKEQNTREKLLEHFDEEVISRLKSRKERIQWVMDEHGRKIKAFCRGMLPQANHYDHGFIHENQHFYYDWKLAEEKDGHFLKIENPLVTNLINTAKQSCLSPTEITFDYDGYGMHLADLRSKRGKSGWLRLSKLKIDSIDTVEKLVFSAIGDDGSVLDQQQCERLMLIPAAQGKPVSVDGAIVDKIKNAEQSATTLHLKEAQRLNEEYFNEEQEKLDRWAEDSKEAINQELKRLEKEIKEAKKVARALKTLEEKTTAQRQIKKQEKKRDKKMMEFFETRKQVDEKSDELLEEIEAKLKLSHTADEVFTIRWNLI